MIPPNKLSCVIGLCLVTSWGVVGLFAVEPRVRILPLGDSLTFGESLTSAQGGYRNRLHTVLTNAGYQLDYLGTLSDSSNPALPLDSNHEGHSGFRIDQIQTDVADWLNSVEDPDVVLLLIGTNDVWQKQLANASTRLGNLIADIAKRRPFAKIIVSNLPPRIDPTSPYNYEADQITFNNAIPAVIAQQVALGRQVTFLNMHDSVLTPFDYSSDGVHPSTGGYVKIGNAWAPKVTDVISPTGTSNPPVIARTTPQSDLTHVSVVFSKPVADDAASLPNFVLSGGLTTSAAMLDATKRIVTLTTSPQAPGMEYSISVSGVRDRTPQQTMIAPQSMVNFFAMPLINGSFEDDFNGWTVTNPDHLEIQSGGIYVPTDGSKQVSFNSGQSSPIGKIEQTFPTTAGQSYLLSFDAGVLSYNSTTQSMLVKVVGAIPPFEETVTIKGPNGGNSTWKPQDFTFVANSSSVTLSFEDVAGNNTNSTDFLIDHVRVDPESTYNLAVTSTSTSGAGMTISPLDRNGNGNGTAGLIRSYQQGDSVTVTAAPTLAGANFLMWRKNGVDLAGSLPEMTLTMDINYALTAVYEPNDPPVAVADDFSTDEDTPLTVAPVGVLANDTDDHATVAAVLTADVSHGDLTLDPNGGFSYVPDPNFHGVDSFSYLATDGSLESNSVGVTITVNPLEEFTQWLDGYSLANGPGDDTDGDGIENLIEYVIGGNPANHPDNDLMPTAEPVTADLDGLPGSEDYLEFTYRRTDLAHQDASVSIKVEWASDLAGPWLDASVTPGVYFDEQAGGAGVQLIKVDLPRSLETGGRLFARLNVLIDLP